MALQILFTLLYFGLNMILKNIFLIDIYCCISKLPVFCGEFDEQGLILQQPQVVLGTCNQQATGVLFY